LEYLIRIDRIGNELVLFYRAAGPKWREAGRKLFRTTQEARGEAIRLEQAAPAGIVASFEGWGCKIPEELRAPDARVARG
jgi:hypothetical protein